MSHATKILDRYADSLGKDVWDFQRVGSPEYLDEAVDALNEIDVSLGDLPLEVAYEASLLIQRNRRRLVQRALRRVTSAD